MKIVDMNVALGEKNEDGKELTPELLYGMMEAYGIDRAVAYHATAKLDHPTGNALMSNIAKESGGRIGFCAVIDPALGSNSLEGEGSLAARLRTSGAEAIRVFPTKLRVAFHPFYFEEVLEAAEELSMPIIIDDNYPVSPVPELFSRLPDMARAYPGIKFIIIRYGTCNGRHIKPLATKCDNVYFTVEKMLDYQQIEELCAAGASSKLLFGSEYPMLDVGGALGLVLCADISDEERRSILAENWEAIKYVNS